GRCRRRRWPSRWPPSRPRRSSACRSFVADRTSSLTESQFSCLTAPLVDLGLQGCVAIVGGSSSGMGRACARALAAEGCNVTLFARRRELLDEAVEEIDRLGSGAQGLAVAGDATDPEALRAVVDRTLERFGRLDIVVNNAGGPPAGAFEDFDEDAWRAAWELTLMSALRLTRLALPALRRSGRGRIVNITSSAVKEP